MENNKIYIKNCSFGLGVFAKKDEEIFYDYSTTMDEDSWTLQCKCGSQNCRKIVKDFKFLPQELQKKYLELNIVQNFIKKQN